MRQRQFNAPASDAETSFIPSNSSHFTQMCHWWYYGGYLPQTECSHCSPRSTGRSSARVAQPGCRLESRTSALRTRSGPQDGWRSGGGSVFTGQVNWSGARRSASTPRTGLEMGLPSEMPARVCAAVGRSMRLCARPCQCVNEWMCSSVSPSAWCTSTMPCCFRCALPPCSSSTSVPTLQPLASIQLSNLFSPRFTCSFMRAFSFLLPSSFPFNLFMGFIEVVRV